MSWNRRGFRRYTPVASRRAAAKKAAKKLEKDGRTLHPVQVQGRKIARTFWGNAWCEHLESYSDYANRLPRGRTYARNGSILDVQVTKGKITALVSGSEIYEIVVKIEKLSPEKWAAIKQKCSGEIGSVIELLAGKLSDSVMEIMTDKAEGLFPAPREISMDCSCPDWAGLCKHLAAVLYGVGARLDHEPELLFTLRGVDHMELLDHVGEIDTTGDTSDQKTIAADDLSDVFGIDMDVPVELVAAPKASKKKASKKKAASKKVAKQATKKAVTKKAVTKKAVTKKAAKKTVAKKAAKKTVTKKAVKKAVAKKAAKKAVTKKAAKKTVAKKTVTKKKAVKKTAKRKR